MTVVRKPTGRPTERKAAPGGVGRTGRTRTWSARVAERSNALDLEPGLFAQGSPRKVALSLKRSAERSRRRKSSPYRSAMSMLTFYLNRAGRTLPASRLRTLERAKAELRDLFGKNRTPSRTRSSS